jgi:Transglycosylase SLT domain
MTTRAAAVLAVLALWPGAALAEPATETGIAPPRTAGSVTSSACRIAENAARASGVPVSLLTRLLWQESRFQAGVTSPKGAQGIAQFLPTTAAEHGLADPFDPEQAIPKAARLLTALDRRFGNFGLAAAAYNAGPDRVDRWLAGTGSLPAETQAYVLAVTGRAAADWTGGQAAAYDLSADAGSCVEITAALQAEAGAAPIPLAPWGVQLSGNFSKSVALASFERAAQHYRGVLGNMRPMILGSVLRSRGTRPFYRVLVPAASRIEAEGFCRAIIVRGGACVAERT